MYSTVLIGVALDARDPFLLDTCVSVVGPLGASRVILAHVRRHDRLPHELLGQPEPVGPAREAHAELEALSAGLRLRLPDVEVLDVYAVGTPARELVKIAEVEGVDLVLVGRFSVPHESPERGLDGRDILRFCACSVLVVPEGAPLRLEHAVVGVDFSRCSSQALVRAAGLFERVTPVYGYHVDPGVAYGGLDHDEYAAKVEQAARVHYEGEVAPLLPEDRALPRLTVMEADRASDALLQVASEQQADAVVMGGYGRTLLAALLLGSTAERMAARSELPVLVVRDKQERLGLLGSLVHR